MRPSQDTSVCLTRQADGSLTLKACNGSLDQQWEQTDDYTKAYWVESDATAQAGQDLVFNIKASRPSTTGSWTQITADTGTASGVSGFWNDSSLASLDGSTWGTLPVYYGKYLALPAGTSQFYVRLHTQAPVKSASTVHLKVLEQGAGDWQTMTTPDVVTGTVKP